MKNGQPCMQMQCYSLQLWLFSIFIVEDSSLIDHIVHLPLPSHGFCGRLVHNLSPDRVHNNLSVTALRATKCPQRTAIFTSTINIIIILHNLQKISQRGKTLLRRIYALVITYCFFHDFLSNQTQTTIQLPIYITFKKEPDVSTFVKKGVP